MDQKQSQKSGFTGSGDFDSDLSVSHEITIPDVEEILRQSKAAIQAAEETIEEEGYGCGCF